MVQPNGSVKFAYCANYEQVFIFLNAGEHWSRSSSGTQTMGVSKRGFASMDPERRRQIAAKGGRNVPKEARGFSRDHALAAEAGRKGGVSVPAEERAFSHDRALAAEAGRKGGAARRGKTRPETPSANP